MRKMSSLVLSIFFSFLIIIESKVASNDNKSDDCAMKRHRLVLGNIGGVIDESCRVGKEQKIAMEMAVHDLNQFSHCSDQLVLHLKNYYGSSSSAASAAIDLINHKQVQTILGSLTLQEAALVWELDKAMKDIPIITINPIAIAPLLPIRPRSLIQMGNDINIQMQCIASIVGNFGWRKVIAIYEQSNSFSTDSGLITYLSDSLRLVDSVVEHHVAFPRMVSMSERQKFIEEELKKLRSMSVKVFIILQSSLDFAKILFEKARKLGMMEKGYVWIVSDDISSLLDSVEPSVIANMQGVIGFKTNYIDNNDSFRQFKLRFARNYRSEYPEEEEYTNPSIYALRAYDATFAIANAMKKSKGKMNSSRLVEYILSSEFEGLSGKISFKNGELSRKPIYRIINVIGRSFREIILWSPEFGFSKDIVGKDGQKMKIGYGFMGDLGSIYWPGGEQTTPKGWVFDGIEKPLRIGIPAKGAFHQFVNVTYDQVRNVTSITGFSIDVFEAAVKRLPYYLPYVLVPYDGSYDEMVAEVSKKVNKTLDGAVGDTEIMADRYEIVSFSQPYIESGLVMVVTVKQDVKKARFVLMKAFKVEMWILMAAMTMLTGIVIWLTEHVSGNPEFQGSFPGNIGSMLWFSVTVLSFAQRESIKSNLSRLVLTAWLFVVFVVSACLTANLASMMTVPRIQSSELDVDYLRSTNAPVGCNGNSFIVRYLIDALRFKPENIKKIDSIYEYPRAFERGDISAAFFVAPHAKVFLAEYCKGYTMTGPSFKLGGFGFVFPKGSLLAADISEAILKVTQSGDINQLEKQILSSTNCSSSKSKADDGPIGPEFFFGLLCISGTISALVLSVTLARLLEMHSSINGLMINRRVFRWASLVLTEYFTRFGTRFVRGEFIRRSGKEMNAPCDESDRDLVAIELTANRSV